MDSFGTNESNLKIWHLRLVLSENVTYCYCDYFIICHKSLKLLYAIPWTSHKHCAYIFIIQEHLGKKLYYCKHSKLRAFFRRHPRKPFLGSQSPEFLWHTNRPYTLFLHFAYLLNSLFVCLFTVWSQWLRVLHQLEWLHCVPSKPPSSGKDTKVTLPLSGGFMCGNT